MWLFAGNVFVNDFAIVENRLDLGGGEFRAEEEMRQGLAAGRAGQVFAAEERRAEARAGVCRDRLDEHSTEAALRFKSANEEDVKKHTSSEAERFRTGLFAIVLDDFEDILFENRLRASGNGGAEGRGGGRNARLETKLPIDSGRKRSAVVCAARE